MKPSFLRSTNASRPCLEGLEPRSLLSALVATLTTDKSVYQSGQPIQFTFTETNNSSEPQDFSYGPSGDGFIVEQAGAPIWLSNNAITPLWMTEVTIQPGQSQTFTSTWNGVPNEGGSTVPPTGTFTVTNQQAPNGPSATFQIESQTSLTVPPMIPAPSAVSATVSVGNSSVERGHRVPIRFTLTNTTNQSVALSATSGPAGYAILDGSSVVGQFSRKAPPAHAPTAARARQLLAPGATKTINLSWIARPSTRSFRPLTPGAYTIEAWGDGYAASTTIQLKA